MGNAATQETQVTIEDTSNQDVATASISNGDNTTQFAFNAEETTLPNFIMNIERLKKLNVFILDFTMRKSCSGNIKGNTCLDKKRIWNTVKDVGFDNFVIANLRENHSIEDEIAAHVNLMDSRSTRQFTYCIADLYTSVESGVPSFLTPAGITKMSKYGFTNIIVDLSIYDPFIDWRKFSYQDFIDLLTLRLEQIRSISRSGRILLCCRDAFDTFKSINHRNKILSFLATISIYLASRYNIFGFMVEDARGALMPWEVAEVISTFRGTMDSNGWHNGHLLIQVGKGYGLADMSVLAALSHGATGIWTSICEEGGISGHSCSASIITNLYRLGNPFISSKFHIGKLCQAAAKVSKIVTGNSIAMRQEVYGPRCAPILYGGQFNGEPTISNSTELIHVEDEADYRNDPLLSMVPEVSDLLEQLELTFGERPYDIMTITNMRRLLLLDTKHKRKSDYYSSVGLFRLYEKAGGDEFLEEMAEIILHDESFAEFDNHPLLIQLHTYFTSFGDSRIISLHSSSSYEYATRSTEAYDEVSSDDDSGVFTIQNIANPMLGYQDIYQDANINYSGFFDAFGCNYIPHMATKEFKELVTLLDYSKTGTIQWSQIRLRAKWALAEYPIERDNWSLEDFIHTVMTSFLLSELSRKNRIQLFANAQIDLRPNRNSTNSGQPAFVVDDSLSIGGLYGQDLNDDEFPLGEDCNEFAISQGMDDDYSGETEGSTLYSESIDLQHQSEVASTHSNPTQTHFQDTSSISSHPRQRLSLNSETFTEIDRSELSIPLKNKMNAFSLTTRSGENILNRRRSSVTAAQQAAAASSGL